MDASEIDEVRFRAVRMRQGYDMGDVDAFLTRAEAEVSRLRSVP